MSSINWTRRQIVGAAAAILATASLPAFADYNPKLLRIGYQKSASTLVLIKSQGTLEKRFNPQGIEVKWVEFPAGPQLLEGLNVGSIDFGYVGEAPPIVAQAAGANFHYVGYELPAPKAEAILVPKDSPIKTLADLKGKRIALNKGSNVHFLLAKALEKAGIKYSEITPAFLAPADARAAFEKGAVDAWVIWDPFTAAAEKQLGARVLVNAEGLANNHQFFLAEKEFTAKRPDIVALLLEESNKQAVWVEKNIKAAAAQLSPIQGLPVEVLELSLSRYPAGTHAITDSVLDSQQKIADVFAELKIIPQPIKTRDAAPPKR
ncbi:MAG TPA: sulfonate ABC transporter substrate-binding protein [Rhodocyclaceae bacterium]|nr:sulfonate ABC transporter substrate-binding protein [Rhodocyclaceae bacterium]